MKRQVLARRITVASLITILGLLLACAAPMALPIANGPRWACPSPMPVPWGEDGPIKNEQIVATANPTTGAAAERETTYYAEWEQEYGEGGSRLGDLPGYAGPPFPSPTAYGRTGNTYMFGQRVEIAPLHALVTAHAADRPSSGTQVYYIDLTFTNPTAADVKFTALTQVWLRTITRADGTQETGSGWGVNTAEARRLNLTIPDRIPPGTSRMRLPVVAPIGVPHVVELRMPIQSTVPTLVADIPTPTPNTALRDLATRVLTVQWVNAQGFGPACDDPGALTDWSQGEHSKAIPRDAMVGLQAPPGAPRVVAIALAQLGKRYVWGSEGPETFDCSGLMQWSYAQIGIDIPRTTATQWQFMRAIPINTAQAGDLIYMDTRSGIASPSRITHVGMLADIDQDGKWDMIHAVSPALGIRLVSDVFASGYYTSRMLSEARTAR